MGGGRERLTRTRGLEREREIGGDCVCLKCVCVFRAVQCLHIKKENLITVIEKAKRKCFCVFLEHFVWVYFQRRMDPHLFSAHCESRSVFMVTVWVIKAE